MRSYSVIIPTMGRDTLDRAIRSALGQTYPPAEIIVVAGKPFVMSRDYPSIVRVVEKSSSDESKWTAAHNRNTGVKLATSELVAFLDDDDFWYSDKMKKQVMCFEDNLSLVLLSCVNYTLKEKVKFFRPIKCLPADKSILEAHYGRKRFFPSLYYTPTPSVVLSRTSALQIPMNEDLLGFEDTWWLYELQKRGHKIIQMNEALLQVTANPIRSISRDTREKNVSWAKKISTVDERFGLNYLRGICLRNSLLSLKFRDAVFYLRVTL